MPGREKFVAMQALQRVALATLLFSFIPSFLCSQHLIGSVFGKADEVPLYGVAVEVLTKGIGTTTEADGRFTLALPDFGSYQIRFSYLGYQSETFLVELRPDRPTLPMAVALGPRVFTTEELVVSANRAKEKTPVTYVNLTATDLAKNNLGQDLPFLLQWTPSVVVTSDAGAGIGYTGIWIRGSDPSRTNVTINGIPLNDSESQGVFWVNLPDFASSADEIQLQRGVGTSTNGAGAFGASINIQTNRLKEVAYASLDAGIGSFGTRRASLQFGTGQSKTGWSLDARLSNIHSDGYVDRARSDLQGYYLSATKTSNKSVWRFLAFGGEEVTYQAWNGIDASLINDRQLRRTNTAGTEREGSPYENEVDDYGQQHYQAHYSRAISSDWALKLSGHYTKGAGFFEQYKADQNLLHYGIPPINDSRTHSDLIRRRWLDNDFYGLVYSLDYRSPNDQTELTIGGGYHLYDGRHFGEVIWARDAANSEIRHLYYDNDGLKKDGNLFIKAQRELLPNLAAYADLQFRFVDYTYLGYNNDLSRIEQQATHRFFNPKAGFYYNLAPQTALYLSFGVAQREPNRNDFTDNPLSSQPRPERLYNTELGYKFSGKRSNIGLNAYHMHYRDQLVLNGQLNDVGEYIRINVPNSYRLGLELQAGYALTRRLQAAGNLSLSRNRIQAYTEFLDDYDADFNFIGQVALQRGEVPLAFSPDLLGAFELTYQVLQTEKQQLAASIMGKYVGRRYLDNSADLASSIAPYFYSDCRLSYSLQPKWVEKISLTLLLNNLFDTLYVANGWSYRYRLDGETLLQVGNYPQATRNFLLSIGFVF